MTESEFDAEERPGVVVDMIGGDEAVLARCFLGGNLHVGPRLTMPEGMPVLTVVGERAFADNQALTGVRLDESVRIAEDGAFERCEALEWVELPRQHFRLGEGVFEGCSALREVKLPKDMREIPRYTFRRCTSLVDIRLPENICSIDEEAFCGCTSLRRINVPDNLYWLRDGAFAESGLEELDLPHALGGMGKEVFGCCKNLRKVRLDDSFTNIPDNTFRCCSALTDIAFPSKLRVLGSLALGYCESLQAIVLPGHVGCVDMAFFGSTGLRYIEVANPEPPEGTSLTFADQVYAEATLIVPQGCADRYRNCEGDSCWPRFATILEKTDN